MCVSGVMCVVFPMSQTSRLVKFCLTVAEAVSLSAWLFGSSLHVKCAPFAMEINLHPDPDFEDFFLVCAARVLGACTKRAVTLRRGTSRVSSAMQTLRP